MSHRSSPIPRIEPQLQDAQINPFDLTPALDALLSVGRDLGRREADGVRLGFDRAEIELGNRMGGLAPRPQVLQSLRALRRARAHFLMGRFDRAAVEIDEAIGVLSRA